MGESDTNRARLREIERDGRKLDGTVFPSASENILVVPLEFDINKRLFVILKRTGHSIFLLQFLGHPSAGLIYKQPSNKSNS